MMPPRVLASGPKPCGGQQELQKDDIDSYEESSNIKA